jgi:hypothetical protein
MKTYNYEIDLMLPMQANKEILFNEAQLKMDSFCNSSVISFIDNVPGTSVVGEKYILSSGDKAGFICYCTDLSKGWQLLEAKRGMLMFVYQENNFFIFDNNLWKRVNIGI